jgi:hypothetical protein
MGFVLSALNQIEAEDRSNVEGLLAPSFGRSNALEQAQNDMGKIEKDVRQCRVNQFVKIVIGIILENEIKILRCGLKLDALNRNQVHCMLK